MSLSKHEAADVERIEKRLGELLSEMRAFLEKPTPNPWGGENFCCHLTMELEYEAGTFARSHIGFSKYFEMPS